MEMIFPSELRALNKGGCMLCLSVLYITFPLTQMETQGFVRITIGGHRPFRYRGVSNGHVKALPKGDKAGKVLTLVWSHRHSVANGPDRSASTLK